MNKEKSLSGQVNQVVRFLNSFKGDTINKVLGYIHKAYNEVYHLSGDPEDYHNKVKKAVKDMVVDIDDVMKIENRDYELFKENISAIIAHKDDEDVIYQIKNISRIQQQYKDIWKNEFKKFSDKLHNEKDDAIGAGEHVKAIAYLHIANNCDKMENMLKSIYKRMNDLTNLSKKDDPSK